MTEMCCQVPSWQEVVRPDDFDGVLRDDAHDVSQCGHRNGEDEGQI